MLIRQTNGNMKEWMGILRFEAIENNYKETDRQLKEQFMCGLNDNHIPPEIENLPKPGYNK